MYTDIEGITVCKSKKLENSRDYSGGYWWLATLGRYTGKKKESSYIDRNI